MQFSIEKRLEKKGMNSSNPSYRLKDCVTKSVFDLSILLDIFSFVSKFLSCNREENS